MAQHRVSIEEKINLEHHDKTRSKYRDGGPKVVRERTEGADFFRKTGKWSVVDRLIDWLRDRYTETIWDKETGQIIHHCDEPLSEHRGHGSAKKKTAKIVGLKFQTDQFDSAPPRSTASPPGSPKIRSAVAAAHSPAATAAAPKAGKIIQTLFLLITASLVPPLTHRAGDMPNLARLLLPDKRWRDSVSGFLLVSKLPLAGYPSRPGAFCINSCGALANGRPPNGRSVPRRELPIEFGF
jgi:hypothetical protein